MTLTTPAQERYTRFSCPNPQCTRFNRPGDGNITHRSWTGTHQHIERRRCTACGREFSEWEGTPLLARSKLPEETVVRLLKCQRWGVCDEGTADMCDVALKRVHRFQRVAAQRAETHHRQVVQEVEVQGVQLDEAHRFRRLFHIRLCPGHPKEARPPQRKGQEYKRVLRRVPQCRLPPQWLTNPSTVS